MILAVHSLLSQRATWKPYTKILDVLLVLLYLPPDL